MAGSGNNHLRTEFDDVLSVLRTWSLNFHREENKVHAVSDVSLYPQARRSESSENQVRQINHR